MQAAKLKISEKAAEAIRQRMKELEPEQELRTLSYADIIAGVDEKAKKIQQDNGTFDVIISTEAVDRTGEIVRQDGWDLSNYKNNSIVLWGHDYYSLGIGVALEMYQTTFRGLPALGARGVFYSKDINPLAQQVRLMYDFGLKLGVGAGCTTSVGFIPKEFDPNDQNVITRSELLEFSFVPVPANQDVGPAAGRSLTMEEANELGLDTIGLAVKGLSFTKEKDIVLNKCKECGKEADAPAEQQSDDYPICKACLAKNWVEVRGAKRFVKKEAQEGDSCQLDDGSNGILVHDPKDPDGPMTCVADTDDKGQTPSGDEANDDIKGIGKEHDRHEGVVKATFDDFRTKAATVIEDQPDPSDPEEKKAAKRNAGEKAMKTILKSLQDRLAEEHDMHRSNNIATFRSFTPPDEKKGMGDLEDTMKALKAEHKDYGSTCDKSFDQFEKKMLKTVAGDNSDGDEDDGNAHTDWITAKMVEHQGTHRDNVVGLAKGFGEGEETEEKANAVEAIVELILENHEWLKYVPPAFAKDIAAGLATSIVETLTGTLSISIESSAIEAMDGTGGHGAASDKGLENYLFVRDLARSLAGGLNEYLSESREIIKFYNHKVKK